MKYKNKNIVLATISALILIAFCLFVFIFFRTQDATTNDNTSSFNEINFSPPTDEEKQAGDAKKDELNDGQSSDKTSADTPSPSTKKNVKPIITSAGQFEDQIEVRAFIPGIYESSGACTVVITKNVTKIERQVEGIKDATTTRCDTVTILRKDFPTPGTWTVKVNYLSPSSQGVSDVSTFEVQ